MTVHTVIEADDRAAATRRTELEATAALSEFTISGCRPFNFTAADNAHMILNDLHGLLSILEEAYSTADQQDRNEGLNTTRPLLLASTFRSIGHLVTMVAFFSDAAE